MMSLKLLIDGEYLDQSSEYKSKNTSKYYFVITDNVCDERFIWNKAKDLIIKEFSKKDLLWNSKTQKGCLFHMFGGLNEFGKFGLVSIGNTIEQANYLYSQTIPKINESFLWFLKKNLFYWFFFYYPIKFLFFFFVQFKKRVRWVT